MILNSGIFGINSFVNNYIKPNIIHKYDNHY